VTEDGSAAAATGTADSAAAQDRSESGGGLQSRLVIGKTVLRQGEPIEVKVLLRNAADKGRQKWTLDSLGNWSAFKADATDGSTWDLEQSRLHNKVNEIDNDDNHGNNPGASITASVGDNWIDPGYDAAGNMTSGPKPGSETVRLHFVFDAWNRLVEVKADDDGDPGAIIATYRHDATGRRIRKLLGANPAEPTLTLDYYHNNTGQIIEVHKDEDDDHPLEQYVWSPRYVHAPILRWRDENTDGENLETLYYCNDANMNVTALVDGTSGSETFGQVVERYLYDPYGKATVCDGSWTPREGNASAFSNEILFTGHRLDPESGLYITLHRHYHPTLGRWMQRDPKGYVDGMGLYQYVGGNPCLRYDPLGMYGWAEFGDDLRSASTAVGDFAAGAVVEYLDTVLPLEETMGQFGYRRKDPQSAADLAGCQLGRDAGQFQLAVEVVAGAVMVVEGGALLAGGGGLGVACVAAAPETGCVSLAGEVVAVPVAVVGAAEACAGLGLAAHGGIMLMRASKKPPLPNKSSKTLRKEWKQETGQQWPKDPKTGQNQDVSHKVPKADEGPPNDVNNIEPKPHDEHMQQHSERGDFERWGRRSQGGTE
jgi:RHS repeat-associated protein